MSIRVEGGNQLGELANALRQAGRTDLIRDLAAELHREAEPMPAAVRQAAHNMLPEHGGLADLVAAARTGVEVRTSSREAKITVAAVAAMDLPRIDRGIVRHPRFGKRDRWYTQHVPPGYFTRTLLARAPQFRAAAERAVRKMADKIK